MSSAVKCFAVKLKVIPFVHLPALLRSQIRHNTQRKFVSGKDINIQRLSYATFLLSTHLHRTDDNIEMSLYCNL